MDATIDLTILNCKLTILVAFGFGGELDKTNLKEFIGLEAIAERWNKPIEIEHFQSFTVIVAGSEKITCSTDVYTDVFAAGVSILRTEIEIKDRILFNDILVALNSNKIIMEGRDFQSFAAQKISEIRYKLNPGKSILYYPNLKKYILLHLRDFTPKFDEQGLIERYGEISTIMRTPPITQVSAGLKEHYGEIITRFLSGETSIRALNKNEIAVKLANDLSYYDEDLFLASTEGVLIFGCEDYIKELRELLELSISLLLLFQIYDRKIDTGISDAFDAMKKIGSSRYYFLTKAPRKLEKSLFKVTEIGLVILDDIEDLMNPQKVTQDWYYQAAYQKMLRTLRVNDFEKVVEHKINSLQDLYLTARELSTEQMNQLLEVVIIILFLWEVAKPFIIP
jgi:hypothetical protein